MTTSKYLDTNVILRLVIKDNLEQLEEIKKLLDLAVAKKVKLYCSIMVIFETEWVLRCFYKFQKNDIVEILKNILSLKEINFDQTEILNLTLENMAKNQLGIEDNYHVAYAITNKQDFFSFDTKANKIFKELTKK
jgi:predicted nucleic-acid-binding protein